MALNELTKVTGPGIHTLSNVLSHNIKSSGIITATKFVGPIEGVITSTDATFTGNVSIGGTLTYEDVTNIDSVGIITARKDVHVGAGLSVVGVTTMSGALNANGNIVITSATPYITFDDTNNRNWQLNADGGNFVIKDTTDSVNRLVINSSGNVSVSNDLDVDGHTNLDNVSVAGVSTFSGIVAAGVGSTAITLSNSHKITLGSAHELEMFHDGSNSYIKQRFFAYPSALNIISENSGINIMSGSGGNSHGGYENAITCHNNGAVKLYYGGMGPHLETYGAGITVQGNIQLGDKLIHNSDTDTYVRFPAADTIAAATAGIERLRITSTGDVNIGGELTQTDSRVHIQDVTRPLQEGTLTLSSATTTNGAADNGATLRFHGHDGVGTRYQASIRGAKENGTSGNYAGYLTFNTRPNGSGMTERLRITSGGSVNIGGNYTQTSKRLYVDGTAEFTSNITCVNQIYLNGTAPQIVFTDTNQDSDFTIKNDFGSLQFIDRTNSNAIRMYANTGGFGGDRLYIANDIVHTGDTDTKIEFGTDQFEIFTAGSSRMHINSDGRFRVGCTAQPSGTVGGFQLDMGSYPGTLRIMSGAGASGTQSASVNIGGSNHHANLHNGSNAGASLSLFNYNTTDGNSTGVSYHNSNSLAIARILGVNISHSNRHGALVFMTSDGTYPEEKMRLDKDGNLGINVTSSTAKLHVEDTAFYLGRFKRTNGTGSLLLEGDGATEAFYLTLRTNNTTANSGCVIEGSDADGNGTSWIKLFTENHSTNAGGISLHTRPGGGSTTERFRILSNGNISVGSNGAAAEKFQVNGGSIAIVGGAGYKIDTHPLVTYASFTGISGGSYAARLGSTGTSTIRSTQIYGGGNHIATFDGVNYRLGINETVPRATLDVRGTAIIADDIGNNYPSTYPPADTQLLVYTSTTGQPITNTNCARLCIATDAKQTGAQGYNGAIDFGNSDVTASGSAAQFNWRVASIMSNAAGDTGNDPYADGDLQFWTKESNGSLSQRVTITASGRFAVNETSPSGLFHVRGAGNSDADAMFFESGSSGTGAKFILMTNDNSDRAKYIQHSAYWTEIGCHNNEGVRFRESDGDIRFYMNGSSGNYNFTGTNISDRNLKENIETITTNSIDLIKQVIPRTFNWKFDRKNIPHGGFIAQEMQPLFPKLINGEEYDESRTDDGDPNEENAGKCNPTGMGFDYNGYTAYLTKAMQELIAKVEALEAEVATLKGS